MGAAIQLHELRAKDPSPEHYDVVVIGGGQAGLSVGYHLARRGLRFVILDAEQRVGDAWRKRWDSLRLFSPARFDALVGMPFPAHPDSFPTHHEMADYLEAYAKRFDLPIESGTRVEGLTRRGARYVIKAGEREFEADQVVVAMSNYQKPRRPEIASALRQDIVQLHSTEYKNAAQLAPGATLVVGAGNSGAEIAMELVRQGREVWLCGRQTGQAPFRMNGFWARLVLARLLFRFVFHRLLTIETPMGRKARPKILKQATPLIRTRVPDLLAEGVRHRAVRVSGAERGLPVLDDGTVLDVSNVIWCTGFESSFKWIELPIFDEQGEPQHEAGVVPGSPGLYFVGLHFLYSMSSSMIHGVSRDAERVVGQLAKRSALA